MKLGTKAQCQAEKDASIAWAERRRAKRSTSSNFHENDVFYYARTDMGRISALEIMLKEEEEMLYKTKLKIGLIKMQLKKERRDM